MTFSLSCAKIDNVSLRTLRVYIQYTFLSIPVSSTIFIVFIRPTAKKNLYTQDLTQDLTSGAFELVQFREYEAIILFNKDRLVI